MLLETNIEKPRILIFSFFKNGKSTVGSREKEVELLKSRRLSFKELIGCYKGEFERSWLVVDKGAAFYNVKDLASKADQESILLSDEYRETQLFYLDKCKTEYLGELKCVSETEAKSQDNYTFDAENNNYFITKK